MSRLRNSAFLSLVAYLLALPLTVSPLPTFGPESAVEDVIGLLAALALVMVFGLVFAVLWIAAWVFKVLGWWSMCKSGMRRFYCITRFAVLLGPIIGVVLLIAGGAALLLEILGSGLAAGGGLSGVQEGRVLLYALPVFLVMAVANVIEGVSVLDVGMQIGVRALEAGAVAYLVAVLLQPLAFALTGDLASGLSWVSGAVSTLSSLLLAVGFHRARGRVIQIEAQREAAGTA